MGGQLGRRWRVRASVAGVVATSMVPLLVLDAVPAGADQVPAGYTMVELTFEPRTGAGHDIAQDGTVVGAVAPLNAANDHRPDILIRGNPNATIEVEDLYSTAFGVSDGWVVGDAWESGDEDFPQPVRWDGGSVDDIEIGDLPAGADSAHAAAVSDNGTAVGWIDIGGTRQPMIWYPGDDPAPMFEDLEGQATDIDANGNIVGWTVPEGSEPIPFTSHESQVVLGEIEALEDLPNARPRAIRGGFVVGDYTVPGDGPLQPDMEQAFRLDVENGTVEDLTFFGPTSATDVNAEGVVVGYASLDTPLVWDTDGSVTTLGSLTVNATDNVTLRRAEAINDAGQITGTAAIDGVHQAVRYDPLTGIPDAAVQHSAQPNPTEVGDQVNFGLGASNSSPGHTAYGLTYEALLEDFTQGVHGSVYVYTTECAGTQLAYGYRVRCTWPELNPGSGVGGGFYVTFAQAGTYRSIATLTHAGPDSDTTDNTKIVDVVVNEQPPPFVFQLFRSVVLPVLREVFTTVNALARLFLGRPWFMPAPLPA